MKTKQPLGAIELRFDNNGLMTGISFIGCSLDGIPDGKIRSGSEESDLIKKSEYAFAKFFTLVNKIELADKEKYKISSVLENSIRNDVGIITFARISFSLDEL